MGLTKSLLAVVRNGCYWNKTEMIYKLLKWHVKQAYLVGKISCIFLAPVTLHSHGVSPTKLTRHNFYAVQLV